MDIWWAALSGPIQTRYSALVILEGPCKTDELLGPGFTLEDFDTEAIAVQC